MKDPIATLCRATLFLMDSAAAVVGVLAVAALVLAALSR
jgi:hypothetical protein